MIFIANDEGRCGVPEAFKRLQAKQDGLRSTIEGIKLVEQNMDIKDNHKVVSFRGSEPVYYWVWTDEMPQPIKKTSGICGINHEKNNR